MKKKAAATRRVPTRAPVRLREQVVAMSCEINAPPAAVYRALSRSSEWPDWLCRRAEMGPGARGRWKAVWDGGYEAGGRFTFTEASSRVSLTWEDAEQPEATRVVLAVKPVGERAGLSVRHSGFGVGVRWKKSYDRALRAWRSTIENLQSVLETGIDLRLARRPMLGINFDVLAAEEAAAMGIAPGHLKLSGVLPGLAAEKAGLRQGDVIQRIGGVMLDSHEAIGSVLARFRAGDSVEVQFLREGRKRSAQLTLSPRETPDVPADPRVVVARAREAYGPFWQDLGKLLAGLTEEEASKPEAEGKWSVKDVVAHLSVVERDHHQGIAWELMGECPVITGNPTVVRERLAAAKATTGTVAELLARYHRDVEESLEMILALRSDFLARKIRYRRVALAIPGSLDHAKGHLAQIQRILRAVVGA